ncbi:High mobility group protein B2 [Tupaia chinensis]|uniref:High mobility group protein B2 n=1 Tax=Tupaia chinensis TaxID=246437 RepID=L9L4L8_TUPCH|nr:High mobility group protein B2 [Tupaia chinensis]
MAAWGERLGGGRGGGGRVRGVRLDISGVRDDSDASGGVAIAGSVDAVASLSIGDIAKKPGEMWTHTAADGKLPCEKAAKLKEKYEKDIVAYCAKGKPGAAKKGVVKAEKSKEKKEEEDRDDEGEEEGEDEEHECEKDDK